MSVGFFQSDAPAEARRKPIPLLPECSPCGLFKKCDSPKMPVFGNGRRKILVCGEGPGETEDRQNRPFVGKAGGKLRGTLSKIGIDLDEDCWTTNAVRCRPTTPAKKNRTPTDKEIGHCRPYLVDAVKELKPHVIIPLGGPAVKSLLGWLWQEDVGAISRWDGWRIPVQSINAWVTPTWHPSYLLRVENQRENDVRELFFERHLRAACKLEGRPWAEVPDWGKQVRVELDDQRAAATVATMMAFGKPLAFDYETSSIKPDRTDAFIYSCAVSDGTTSVSFPWHGAAREQMRIMLASRCPKIGFNIAFESKWTYKEFDFWIDGESWVWDGMLAAHVLDNRPEICSAAFQAFVLLGVDDWKGGIKPYLKSRRQGHNEPNRIKEAPLPELLHYGGLDALYEWKIAQIQARQFGVKL
jgi:uracil-DNA glycosylase family 4